jgi:hypothetical protein
LAKALILTVSIRTNVSRDSKLIRFQMVQDWLPVSSTIC